MRTILDSLVDLPRRANSDPAAAWIEALSAVRLGLRAPAEVEAEFGGDVDGLPEVFERYRAPRWRDGASSTSTSRSTGPSRPCSRDPAARRSARAACRLLLVDEFQDLTPAHLLLIRLLAGPEGAVFGVGDDDQTIYGYSGASPEWLIDYRRFFPGAGEHPLEVNYRCPAPVVEAAADAARPTTGAGCDKQHRRRPRPPRAGREPSRSSPASDPLAATVEVVTGLLAGGSAAGRGRGAHPGERLPGAGPGGPRPPAGPGPPGGRPELPREGRGPGGPRLAPPGGRTAGGARRRRPRAGRPSPLAGASRREVLEWMGEQAGLAGLERLGGRLSGARRREGPRLLRRPGEGPPCRVVLEDDAERPHGRARRGRPGPAMELLEGSRRRLDRSAQTDDLNALVALAGLHPEPEGFEAWLRDALARPGSPDGVELSTIHRVKGQEWPHVVLHDVTEGVLPHRLAEDLEEERRVFHVGLTRCSASVHVVAGQPASGFVAELASPWRPGEAPAGEAPGRRARPGPARPEERSRGRAPRAGAPRAGASGAGAAGWGGPGAGAGGASGELAGRVGEALRRWRSERAAAASKPAYVFLHDQTIEAISATAPSSLEGLAAVKGIGPAKLDAYGEELLGLIEAARAEPEGGQG